MSKKRSTGFDRYVADRMKSPDFAKEYIVAKAEIDAIDTLMRHLDEAREAARLTKAALAERTGMPAETVRKLFTAEAVNPTLRTVHRLATQLGYRLALVKNDEGHSATKRGVRARKSSASARTRA